MTTERIQVNVRSRMNTSAASHTEIDGRDVIVIPSVTLPDDIVMNDIKYPADEIEASYMTLDQTPAPFGHPLLNGNFVSASHPIGINKSYIGAWNANPRRKDGRVFIDKMIDVEYANQSENGKRVLAAIEAGDPIHTSTGLYCNITESNEEGYKYVASGIYFDHDAILLDETGAATPEDGVGIFVNSGKREEIRVVNSIYDWVDDDIDWAGMRLLEAIDQRDKVTRWHGLKSALLSLIGGETDQPTNVQNSGEEKMDKELKAALDALTTNMTALTESVKAIVDGNKTLTDQINTLAEHASAEAEKAKTEAEAKLANAVKAVVDAGILSEEVAKVTPIETLNALVDSTKGKTSAPLGRGNMSKEEEDEFADYDMNAVIKKATDSKAA